MGKIIIFEGIDYAGKGTQIKFTTNYLRTLGIEYQQSQELGATPYGTVLRALIKHPELTIGIIGKAFANHSDFHDIDELLENEGGLGRRSDLTEFYLFCATRAEYVDKIIKPALVAGKVFISDRLYDGARAYSGGGRFHGDPEMIKLIEYNNNLIMAKLGTIDQLTLFLDIPVTEMLNRMSQANGEKDAYFERHPDKERYYNDIRNEYLQIAEEEPHRFKIINADQKPEKVWAECQAQIDRFLAT